MAEIVEVGLRLLGGGQRADRIDEDEGVEGGVAVSAGRTGGLMGASKVALAKLLDVDNGRPIRRLEPLDVEGRPATYRNSYVRKVPEGVDGDGGQEGRA